MSLPLIIVGAGGRGRRYASLVAALPGVHLVGVIGRGQARASALADEYGVPWAHEGDLEDATDLWGPQGAIVCPSSDANARMARRIAARGLSMLLETPAGLNAGEAQDLLRFVTAQEIVVGVAEQNPFAPEVALLRTLIARGRLGRVRVVACDMASYRYHATAVGRALLGRPRGTRAVALTTRFDAFPRHAAGVVAGTVEAEGTLFHVRDGEGIYAPDGPWAPGSWSVYGERGSWIGGTLRIDGAVVPVDREVTTLDEVSFTTSLSAGRVTWNAELTHLPLDDDERASARCLTNWVAALRQEETVGWTLADAVADLRWIEGLEQSARLGGGPVLLR